MPSLCERVLTSLVHSVQLILTSTIKIVTEFNINPPIPRVISVRAIVACTRIDVGVILSVSISIDVTDKAVTVGKCQITIDIQGTKERLASTQRHQGTAVEVIHRFEDSASFNIMTL